MTENLVPLNDAGTHVFVDGEWLLLNYGFCAGGWVDDFDGDPAPEGSNRLVPLHESGTWVTVEGRGAVPICD